jgi:hypothetical protein
MSDKPNIPFCDAQPPGSIARQKVVVVDGILVERGTTGPASA